MMNHFIDSSVKNRLMLFILVARLPLRSSAIELFVPRIPACDALKRRLNGASQFTAH